MYSTYDRYRTYDMSDDIRVIYGQAIRVRIIRLLCTTLQIRIDAHVIWYK
jgi:hypothetical protein